MIGDLGGLFVQVANNGVTYSSGLPVSDTGTWTIIELARGAWGDDPAAIVVPVSGLYRCEMYAQVQATDVGQVSREFHGFAALGLGGSVAKIDSYAPVARGDGLSTYGAASAAFLIELTAGDPVEWSLNLGDGDPTITEAQLIFLRCALELIKR